MLEFFEAIVLVALVVAFIYIVLNKWGVWEYLQVHADSWFEKIFHKESSFFNKLFSCSFCTCWWTSLIICIIVSLVLWDWHFLLVPFCSVPLSRIFV